MKKPTHIAALVPYRIYPAKMGGQKGIALFYRYLSELVPVTMITTCNNDSPEGMNANFLPVLSNSKSRYVNPFLFFSLRKIIRQNNCTHLILEHPYYGWLGILLKLFCKIELVIHSHNIEALRFKSTGKWWWKILLGYERFVHRKAGINFFITDEDRDFALKHFSLAPARCHTITYGSELSQAPPIPEKENAAKVLKDIHQIGNDEKILLFNGTLDYLPNQQALDVILNELTPALLGNPSLKYKIIICGKGLPDSYDELKAYASKNIIYAGFVNDIDIYFKGADLFINPVIEGGGIKTKVVEALGHGLTVVSTQSGAIGVPPAITGNKLVSVFDGDWQGFANAIATADTASGIPDAFFGHFYWGNIAQKVKRIIS